jgi:Uncharacterised nucleotidyltransferase
VSSARRRLGALLMLCQALGADRDAWARTRLVRSLRPPPVSWPEVLALATELNVREVLCGAVHLADHHPARAVDEPLRGAQLANTARNIRLRDALTEAVAALNRRGVVPLLFKGALQLVDGTPRAFSERWMADLDLLVPADQMAVAGEALEAIGYAPVPGKPFFHPHELPYARPGAPGPIELHPALGSAPTPSVLPATEAWAESSELAVGGGRARALAPTHQVLHGVLHSAIQDLNHAVAGLPLRHLLILADLAQAHGRAVDWPVIYGAMENHGLGRPLRDHIWLAHRFAGMERPPGESGSGAQAHEALVLASFAVGWPADTRRNLRFAFGRDYLDFLYGHGDRPVPLAGARARHALRILGRDGPRALSQTRVRRGG